MTKDEWEVWYVILNMNCKYEICRMCPKSGLFKGTYEECEKWIEQKQKEEELEKEADEYADKHAFRVPYDGSNKFYDDDFKASKEGYLAGAEPRKKQIAVLGERCLQLQKDKGNLIDWIKELEQKIEKMINEIDKTLILSTMREGEICDIQDIFRKYGFKRNDNDKWEIKEK